MVMSYNLLVKIYEVYILFPKKKTDALIGTNVPHVQYGGIYGARTWQKLFYTHLVFYITTNVFFNIENLFEWTWLSVKWLLILQFKANGIKMHEKRFSFAIWNYDLQKLRVNPLKEFTLTAFELEMNPYFRRVLKS